MCTTLWLVGSVGPSEKSSSPPSSPPPTSPSSPSSSPPPPSSPSPPFSSSSSPPPQRIPASCGLSFSNFLTVWASVGLLQYIGAWLVWLDYTLNRRDGEVAWQPRCRGSVTVLTACALFDQHLGRKGKKAGHQHGKECSPDSFFQF